LIDLRGRGAFVRLLGSGVLAQALVSAASLLVSLILIRRQSEVQYGYYVLVTTALLLLAAVQAAFLGPPMITRLAHFGESARRDLIGGMLREQRRLLPLLWGVAASLGLLLYLTGTISPAAGAVVLAGIVASMATLHREFFRMVLLAYRRPLDVIRSDSVYVTLMVVGALLATFSPLPAATAALTLGLAAAAGAILLSRALWRHDPWNIDGAQGILREFAPVGAWSVFGATVQWAFSQGYTYIVAGMLGVQAVAAIAATRLLLMPVSLLSSGLFQIMLPTATRWMHVHGAPRVFRRLIWFCSGVGLLTLCYCAVMWELRDWIFTTILKKQFDQRDQLLLLWCLVFLLIVLREQLVCILVARSRFPQLSTLTAFSAVLSLATGYGAMQRLGVIGGLLGVATGELVNVVGIVLLTRAESRRLVPAPA